MPLSPSIAQTWHWPGGATGGLVAEPSLFGSRAYGYGWYRAVWGAARGTYEDGWLAWQDPKHYLAKAGPLDITHRLLVQAGDPPSDPAKDLHFTFGRGRNIAAGTDPLAFGYYAASVARDGSIALWRKLPGGPRLQVASGKLPFALAPTRVYRVRLVLAGSSLVEALRFKVWPDADGEPAAFHLLWEDESAERLREAAGDVFGVLHTTNGIVAGAAEGATQTAPLTFLAAAASPAASPATSPAGGVLDTTADDVWGQPGFTTGAWNYPGTDYLPSAANLGAPAGVLRVAGGLLVSDSDNNRILFFPDGSKTATAVYGQPDLTHSDSGVSATALSGPSGLATDAEGGLYVADTNNHRVVYYPPGQTVAIRVWGRATLDATADHPTSLGGLYLPTGVAVDESGLYVADRNHSRVLFYSRNGDGSWPSPVTEIDGLQLPIGPDAPVPAGVIPASIDTIVGGGGFQVSVGRGADGEALSKTIDASGILAGVGDLTAYMSTTATAASGETVTIYCGDSTSLVGGQIHLPPYGGPVSLNTSVTDYAMKSITVTWDQFIPATYADGAMTMTINSRVIELSPANVNYPDLAALTPGAWHTVQVKATWAQSYSQDALVTIAVDGTDVVVDAPYPYFSQVNTYDMVVGFSFQNGYYTSGDDFLVRNVSVVAVTPPSNAASYFQLYVDDTFVANVYNHGSYFVDGLAPGDHTARLEYAAPNRASFEPQSPETFSRIPIPAAGVSTVVLPARVYGQADLSGEDVNRGRGTSEDSPAADTLYCPEQVLLDAEGGLYVADLGNCRVLHFPPGSTTPDRVYGQNGSFTRADGAYGYNNTNANFYQPTGMALTPDGIWIADQANDRIMFFPGADTTGATMLIGQADFAADEMIWPPTSASVSGPKGLFWDATGLYVADADNNRVLRFSSGVDDAGGGDSGGGSDGGHAGTPPTWHVSVFSVDPLPYKQPRYLSFQTQPGNGFAGKPLDAQPEVHVLDVDGQLAVGYSGVVDLGLAGGSAGCITGSGSMVATAGIAGFRGLGLDTAGTYQLVPSAMGLVGEGSRPFTVYAAGDEAGMPEATDLWGQADYTGNAPNRGGAASAVTLNDPRDVVVGPDGTVWVVDTGNNRVLGFAPGAFPHTASIVVGQPDFAGTAPGAGLGQMNAPTAMTAGSTVLFVSDTGNNRVLRFDRPTEADPWPSQASLDIGVRDPAGAGGNTQRLYKLLAPRGLVYLNSGLWIADRDHHRIVLTGGAGYLAKEIHYGQPDEFSATENYNPDGTNAVNVNGLSRPTALACGLGWFLVLDSGNHRVLGYPMGTINGNDMPASIPTRVWGHEDFDQGDAPAGVDAVSFAEGVGLAVDSTGFWVADRTRNRALHFLF